MESRKKAAVEILILSIICGSIIWHVMRWHAAAMYDEMFTWIGTDRAYITVLYNLGLMIVLGVVLGLLLGKIAGLSRYRHPEIKNINPEKGDAGL
jgi:hypothetical protein